MSAGRLHPFEHRAAEEQADGHDKQPEQRAERDGAVARAGDAVRVMTADAARDQNVHADRDADESVDDEIDERGRRADGGKGDTAREFADDDDVRPH